MSSVICRLPAGQPKPVSARRLWGAALVAAALVHPSRGEDLEPLPEIPEAQAATPADMKPYEEVLPNTSIKFRMVPIPGGKFLMGSPDNEPGRKPDEGPQHEVEVEPFWMGACEVTWDEYETWQFQLDIQRRKVLKLKPTKLDAAADAVSRPTEPYTDMTFGMGKRGYPAICMTQLAAKTYCQWLTAKTGRYYRLPTEAEWEYACRAGATTAYSFGNDPEKLDEYAWYQDNSGEQYARVGKKKPNPWGLHDMHGNVSEWVLDQYAADFYQICVDKGIKKNPFLSPTTLYPRAVRGGSWADPPEMLRSAARRGSDPSWKQQDPQIPQSKWYHTDALWVGFRVIRPFRQPTEEEKIAYWGTNNDPD